ncbi:hypothetical protein AAC387_Pa09g1701 [Persea americana]
MEEELRAKALASMSVSAKPKNIHLNNTKPSPNPKEEGELSSPSEPDDDEEEEQDKPQEIPASIAATCSSGGSDRLRVQSSSVAQRNKLVQAPGAGKCLPPRGVARRVDRQLPTTIMLNQKKHSEMNPQAPKSSSLHTSGRCAPSDANDNLVIRFSDDDSETDSEEHKKERTSERDNTGNRVNKYKSSAASLQLNKKILLPQSLQMATMSNKASSSRLFISSMNKIHGPNFRGLSAAPVPREAQIQRHVPFIRSSTGQERGSVQGVNSTATELESLRQQIARRENELKLQRKSIPQTKDIFPSSDRDCHGTKLGSRTTKMSRSASSDAVGLIPKEQERKRLKRDEHSHSQPSAEGQPQMPKNVHESALKFRERVLEKSCCMKDHNPVSCSQYTKAVPIASKHPTPSRQPGKGDQLDLVPSRSLVEVEKHRESSLSFVEAISSSLPDLVEPSNQGDDHLSGGGLTGCRNRSNTSPMLVDSLTNRTVSPAKVTSSLQDGASRLLKLSSPTKSSNEMLKHRISSGRINSSNLFPNKEVACQHTLMRSNGHNGNMPADRMPPCTSDGIFDDSSNHAPGSRLGTSDAPVCDGSLSSYNGQLNAVGHTSSYVQPLVDIEEMYDKELEEAQDLRRRCELEERNALKAYRSAQRALLDANEKCNILYQKRTLFLAQLRACMMVDSSSLWHQRCNNHEETESGSLKNVAKSNLDMLPSSSCPIQAYVSNVQCTDGAPIATAYQNINGHDSGADPCSEPDASTSELGHHKDNSAADGVLSPSNDPNMSADDEEEVFPPIQSRLICDNKQEKLEERTMDMSQGTARRCFIENAQDSALLEASLRSKLCARLGIGTSSRSSGSCLNAEPSVDKGADNDLENKKTHTITTKLSFLSDLPFLNAEQAQMDDMEGLGRHGSKTFQVSSRIHDQNYCDKFSSDYGSHRSTERSEPEESSSSFKECLRPTFASFSPLPSSVPKIVFRHVKVLAPDSCEVFQTSNDEEHSYGIILKKVGNISCNDNLIDACGAHTSSNCAGEAKTGTLDSRDLTIDPFWPHCMFELRGKCNNDECTWQHVRDYNKKNMGQLNDYANSEGRVSPVLALGRFVDVCGIQHSPHHHIMPVPTYRIGTSLMKADAHSYGCLFARSIYQYWQWDFCTSFAVPFSVQRILPADVPSLHAGDGCIKEHGYWNSLSLYFHNPDNKTEQDKQVSAAAEQSLELALDIFHGSANKPDGKKKALTVLSEALKANPTSLFLWIVYLHIYYRKEKAIGKDDMFHFAIQHNEASYELWLMYINSRMQHGDRLDAYHSALLTFCRIACADNKDGIHASACILDLFLQMADFLCMSGDLEKIISGIYELLSPTMDFDSPSHISLLDILKCLTMSDKCIFWVCCVYLVLYKKLPQEAAERLEFEQQLLFELEWPSVQLKADEKYQSLELMKMAVEMVTREINGDSYGRDHSNGTALRSVHSLAINHVRCNAAVEGIDSAENLLAGYMKLYPTCIELVLTSARWQKDNLGDAMHFEKFEEALSCWPEEDPGVHCIWNQYAEFALENGRITLAKKLMLRWLESVWQVQDPEKRKFDGGENAFWSNPKAELFGLLNLSLNKFLQNDKVGARLTIDKALKLAAAEDLKHMVREHAVFILSGGADSVKGTPASEIPSLLLSYLADVRFFPISEPLSRRFFRSIRKPRNQELVNKLLGPVSLDCSLTNAILKELYGPSLVPEHFGNLTDLVDFVEALLEILPANYHLAMSVCKLIVRISNLNEIASATVMFWAGTLLVNSIFQAFPVAPELVWIEGADVLGDLGMWDISERFHQQAVLVYPFSTKLWRSYCNLAEKTGDMNAVINAARERGIKLN